MRRFMFATMARFSVCRRTRRWKSGWTSLRQHFPAEPFMGLAADLRVAGRDASRDLNEETMSETPLADGRRSAGARAPHDESALSGLIRALTDDGVLSFAQAHLDAGAGP